MNSLKQLEIEMTKAAFQVLIFEAIAFGVAMGILYMVIRGAVREGINDSSLGKQRRRPLRRESSKTHNGDTLPPMHAD